MNQRTVTFFGAVSGAAGTLTFGTVSGGPNLSNWLIRYRSWLTESAMSRLNAFLLSADVQPIQFAL
jgi:hypothetical protein